MFHPTEAYRFVSESIAGRCEVVSLVEKDYLATLESAAKAGLCGGILYDALQLRCAEKARCDRIYTFDITPLAPLLVGRKNVAAWIDTYDAHGWYVDLDFTFISDPLQASPKPPAVGILPVFFKRNVTADDQPIIEPVSVTIPVEASQVFVRLFTTGHGASPPSNCDEFCRKNNRILVDGAPAWEQVPWQHCNLVPDRCREWNACGATSCRFDRSGWCPGLTACHDDEPCDQDIEVTGALPPGETRDVLYEIQNIAVGGSIPAYWNYSLVVYWY